MAFTLTKIEGGAIVAVQGGLSVMVDVDPDETRMI